jgi:hypothetical protein
MTKPDVLEDMDTADNNDDTDAGEFTNEPNDYRNYDFDLDRDEIIDFFFRFREELRTRCIDHVFADQIRSSFDFHVFVQMNE